MFNKSSNKTVCCATILEICLYRNFQRPKLTYFKYIKSRFYLQTIAFSNRLLELGQVKSLSSHSESRLLYSTNSEHRTPKRQSGSKHFHLHLQITFVSSHQQYRLFSTYAHRRFGIFIAENQCTGKTNALHILTTSIFFWET